MTDSFISLEPIHIIRTGRNQMAPLNVPLNVLLLSLLLLLLLNDSVFSAYDKDEIKHLPGWSPRPMSSKQYSGFLQTQMNGMDMQMHYWMAECEVEPHKKPLVFWFNGGPGASSLFGFQLELGPYLLTDESMSTPEYEATGVPQLFYNPSGWQKVATIVALSMPPPIGFSYCNNKPSSSGTDCGHWNDSSTALVTYRAINSFFKKFPEYLGRETFLTGESYAGTYVPTIARLVVENEATNNIKLAGLAVGDACTPPFICGRDAVGPYWNIEFLYGKTAFSTALYNKIMSTCTQHELLWGGLSDQCNQEVNKIGEEVGGYWVYSYFDDCWYSSDGLYSSKSRRRLLPFSSTFSADRKYWGPPITATPMRSLDVGLDGLEATSSSSSQQTDDPSAAGSSSGGSSSSSEPPSKTKPTPKTKPKAKPKGEPKREPKREPGSGDSSGSTGTGTGDSGSASGGGGVTPKKGIPSMPVARGTNPKAPNSYPPCDGASMQSIYLSLPAVKDSLHVPQDAVFFQTDNGVGFVYHHDVDDIASFYREVINDRKLRVLVYNGDTDPCINAFQAQNWTSGMGFKETQSWRPWTIDGCQRMGGAVTRYEGGFDFLTIRGSGHMVPEFKPQASLEFLSRFLNNEDYKPFVSTCVPPPDGIKMPGVGGAAGGYGGGGGGGGVDVGSSGGAGDGGLGSSGDGGLQSTSSSSVISSQTSRLGVRMHHLVIAVACVCVFGLLISGAVYINALKRQIATLSHTVVPNSASAEAQAQAQEGLGRNGSAVEYSALDTQSVHNEIHSKGGIGSVQDL